ncbi:MAG: sigma 54-interacting transcriptional regulator [Thermosynechococcaceae cyanobacterium MS004]|nr:sigma 54-interacting transcriptional regulator [Thermosynechococcaceae cyanobacterium MS004]
MSNPGLSLEWLKERTMLGTLSDRILEAIASKLQPESIAANRRVILEQTLPNALYVLVRGRLERYRTSPNSLALASSLLPGSVLHLTEILLEQPVQDTIVTLTDCEFWVLPKAELMAIAQQFPEMMQSVSRQLAEDVVELSAQLAFEQERQAILRPYLLTKAKRGIVGTSRYAVRLRQQIKEAARDRKPVLIFGEPGLEKDNIATLIHFGSPSRREPMIQVNCNTLQVSGAELFGRMGGKPGLLEALGMGTILLNNIHELDPALLPQITVLLEQNTFIPVRRNEGPKESQAVDPKSSQARVILVAEKTIPGLENLMGHTIKVPPLRVRKPDLKAQVTYYLSLMAQRKGEPKRTLTPEALRRLQAYSYPGNLAELQSLMSRAIAQAPEQCALTDELFWPAEAKKQQFRLNLLNTYPKLRQFLRSDWWPTRINYGFTLGVFALVVFLLFWGPQDRQHNVALNLFWAWWWPLVLIGFPFVGRLWCAVCPFMIYGEAMQWLSLKVFPRTLQRWPRDTADRWGGWFLLGLFTLIFLWEELWNLENTAYLSSWLLLLITAGAVICSQIFERRFWCRYLCPIGGMNGLFAKLSMTELRAQQGTCSAECTTYQCYKGGPVKGEGQETLGCPLYSHPAQLVDNRDCVLCMTCLKACPHRSVELNLRPPGIELWTTHQPRSHEVALLLLLLGGIFLHRLPEIEGKLGLDFHLTQFWPHAGVSVAVLAIAALIPLFGQGFLNLLSPGKHRPFLELAYGYLPLVLCGTLAHYLRLGLNEAGQVLPVTLATFGLGDRGVNLPVLIAHPAVTAFLQGTVLVMGTALTGLLIQKIGRQPITKLWPHQFTALGLLVLLWQVIV